MTAFKSVLAGLEGSTTFEISREDYPVSVSRDEIRARVAQGQPVPFLDLFEPGIARGKLISVFLALLELVRSAEVRAFQDGPLGAILIFPADDVPPDEA